MCGGGGGDLEESVSCRGMHVALPWVNPPSVCVCVCVRADWVRALLVSLVLIKGAFELVSKTTSAVAWDEKCLQTGEL